MKRIDEYVKKLYEGLDSNDEEVEILKEEMKSHLYDKVNDLIKEGCCKEESITRAIKEFGDESSFTNEMSKIINNQKKYTKILMKICIIVFAIGLIVKIGGIITREAYIKNSQNDGITIASDALNNIADVLRNKTTLTNEDKNSIDKILNEFNDKNSNGLYSIKITKEGENNYGYEYERKVSPEMTLNDSSGVSGIEGDWIIHRKMTDNQSLYDSVILNNRFNIDNISNAPHNILNNLSFWLVGVSWVLFIIYITQNAILKEKFRKELVILLSIETIIIFIASSSEKGIVSLIIGGFMLLNLILQKIKLDNKEIAII